ncbi:MAG: DUF4424 domain-containing protein [Caldiserica bacterium]|jgi:tetratricopeptide (TPR) repeat protein|nr:DUF4424 domain-containing protein [Caldisericota bacterium]MDH7563231.1 hypothetical protein [Caldisericota bacterium]
MDFLPGEQKIIEVKYSLPFNRFEEAFVYYALQTGATWMGPVGQGTITFFWDGLTSKEQIFDMSIEPSRAEFQKDGSLLVWEFSNWEPDRDLSFYLMPPSWENRISSLLQYVEGAEGEARYHRERGLAYLLGALGPRFWGDYSLYYISPRSATFALAARAEAEFEKALTLEPENGTNYFLLGMALSLMRWKEEERVAQPEYDKALELIDKGLGLDSTSHFGKYLKSSILVKEAVEFLDRGEVEKAAEILGKTNEGVLPEGSMLLLVFWQPSLDYLHQELPPSKIRVTTFLRADQSGYKELELVPGVFGNEELYRMLGDFLPLSLLYAWDPDMERSDLRIPFTYTPSSIIVRLPFEDPEELKALTQTLTIYDIPLMPTEAKIVLELLKAGEVLKSGSGVHFQFQLNTLELLDLPNFQKVREAIQNQTNFPEVYLFKPVPPLLKKTALDTVSFREAQVLAAAQVPSLELVFLYDQDNEGKPDFEKRYTPSLAKGASVDITFPETENRTLGAIIPGFLGVLLGIVGIAIVRTKEKKEFLFPVIVFLAILGYGFFLLYRAMPFSWLEVFCGSFGFLVASLGYGIFRKGKPEETSSHDLN